MKKSRMLGIFVFIIMALFLIKGILSEIGYMPKYSESDLYTFSYLGFALSAIVYFEIFILEPLRQKEEEEELTPSS